MQRPHPTEVRQREAYQRPSFPTCFLNSFPTSISPEYHQKGLGHWKYHHRRGSCNDLPIQVARHPFDMSPMLPLLPGGSWNGAPGGFPILPSRRSGRLAHKRVCAPLPSLLPLSLSRSLFSEEFAFTTYGPPINFFFRMNLQVRFNCDPPFLQLLSPFCSA